MNQTRMSPFPVPAAAGYAEFAPGLEMRTRSDHVAPPSVEDRAYTLIDPPIFRAAL